MDNSNFKKKPQKSSLSRPATTTGSRAGTRPPTSRSYQSGRPKSPPRSRSMSRSVQVMTDVRPANGGIGTSVNPNTIKDFEAALNSSRSIHEAPLTPHQLNLTKQYQNIGGPGYGNK